MLSTTGTRLEKNESNELPEIWDKMAAKHTQCGHNGGKFV